MPTERKREIPRTVGLILMRDGSSQSLLGMRLRDKQLFANIKKAGAEPVEGAGC
jgi:hypothetical protein